ncbi:WD40/YVTN repeat-like-containing domain [Phytophthora cactorum]|nr:WD40/YVTN repeat-like-containing domain [Phytophthora cactorum]
MVRRLLLLLLAVLLTCLSRVSSTGDGFPTAVRLVTIHPHNVSAFTEGLVFDDGALIESTGSTASPSSANGATQSVPFLQEFRFDVSIFGEGVTVLGDKLFALTYKAQQVLVLSRRDFQLIGQFPLTTSTKEGWGLTTDGEFLIASDGSAKLHHNITVRKDGKAVANVNELEYVEGELLANVWFEDHILRIDIATGDVLEQIDLDWIPNMVPNLHTEAMMTSSFKQDAVMNGIAYDPVTRHVFVTGKLWDSMFELELSYLNSHDRHIVP